MHELPRGHFVRRLPLGELRAECRNKASTLWRPVYRPQWAIAKVCYDELGEAWTSTSEFRFPLES